jgi:hypothetical protein
MKISKMFPIMLLAAAGLVVASPGAQAAPPAGPPPSLAGEVFLSTQTPEGGGSTFSCTNNQAGTFTYHATGDATGPYPGTFVEDITIGTAAIPVPPDDTSTLTSFHATFTITSTKGTVTGTKDLTVSGGGFAWCLPPFAFFQAPALTYSATINTGGASYRDSGTASAQDALFQGNGIADHLTFSETFLTSNGVVPVAPATADECKNGGWQNYPQFKNQGQCVSYVQNQKKSGRQ